MDIDKECLACTSKKCTVLHDSLVYRQFKVHVIVRWVGRLIQDDSGKLKNSWEKMQIHNDIEKVRCYVTKRKERG